MKSFPVFLTFLLLSVSPSFAVTISGTILSLDSTPLDTVSVNLTGTSSGLVVTDNTGAYSFSGLTSGGTYTVTVSAPGLVFTPPSRTFTNLTSDTSGQNFVNGTVWSGGGSDALASNKDNWASGQVPQTNDIVRFDGSSGAKGCVWDSTTPLRAMQLAVGFSSSVTAGIDIVISSISIAGGSAVFNSHEVEISGNFVHTGGTFTWSSGGRVIWIGTNTVQLVSMVKNSLGGNFFGSYFNDFQVSGSTSVRATSGLVINGSMQLGVSARFEAGGGTHTLTAGSQPGAVSSGPIQWNDTAGTFVPGGGTVQFDGGGNTFTINQGAASAFQNVSVIGSGTVKSISPLVISGNLSVGEVGSTVQLDLGNVSAHTVAGSVTVGPSSLLGPPALSLGGGNISVGGTISVGTATLSVAGGQITVQGNSFTVGSQGTLLFSTGTSSTLVLADTSHLDLNGGSWVAQGPATVTSASPGTARYGLNIGGTVNFQSTVTFQSMDVNGFHLSTSAIPTSMKFMKFGLGAAGGAALNFDPVSVASAAIESPQFDATISTNIRAIINPAVVATSSIVVTDASGVAIGPAFEVDPSSVVHWGILGTPVGFLGSAQDASRIVWSWTPVNKPLGFVVKASSGGALSPSLSQGTTYWTEVNLDTNTSYSRVVEAFTESLTADSSVATRTTLAAAPTNVNFVSVGFSSATLTWQANTNSAGTVYLIKRSTSGVSFTQVASGTIAQLVPYADRNLISQTTFTYRVGAVNDDGLVADGVDVTTVTSPVPPTRIDSVSPSPAINLGLVTLTLTGANFQSDASVSLHHDKWIVFSSTCHVVSNTQMTALFNLTGLLATTWDMGVENPDRSVISISNFVTIADATSTALVTIGASLPGQPLTLTDFAGHTEVDLGPGAVGNARVYLSADPGRSPLSEDPAVVTVATQTASSFVLIPGTLREVDAFAPEGRYVAALNAPSTLSISYPDADGDGVVDSPQLHASALQIMTYDETKRSWERLPDSAVDLATKRVQGSLLHFSLYALFGSNSQPTLDDVKIFPSPWKRGSGGRFDAGTLTFSNLTEAGVVQIYSLKAELVNEITYDALSGGIATWNGRNQNGSDVASGIYLVKIKPTSGSTRIFKVGVER